MTTVVTTGAGLMKTIQLRDPKANLSAVVDQASAGHPSLITRYRKPEAVVLSYDE